jgi:hypothetical protein
MPMRHDAADATCCDVEMRVSDETFAGIGTEQPTLKRAAHDVPDAAVLAPATPFVATFVVAQRPPAYAFVTSYVPDRLYLRTARLRL